MQFHAKSGLYFPDGETHFTGTTKKGKPVWDDYQADRVRGAVALAATHDLAVDVGAHVGLIARQLAGSFRRVLAFEPHPDTFACLVQNTQFLGGQVDCRQAALGAARGELGIENMRGNSGDRQLVPGGKGVTVLVLDELAFEHPVGLVKIDVQGYEAEVVRGARKFLKGHKPVVLIEQEPRGKLRREFSAPHSAVEMLAALGMTQVAVHGADQIWAFCSAAEPAGGDE